MERELYYYNNNTSISSLFSNNRNSTTALKAVSDINVQGVITTAFLNLFVFLVFVISYEFLRRAFPSVYRGRRKHVGIERSVSELPNTFFPLAWVWPVLKVPWKNVRKAGGLDAYMFLRYIRLCQKYSLISAGWGMVILWPTFYTGENDMGGFYTFSMANIQIGDELRLWVPTLFMWFMTLYVFFIIDEEYKHYVELRMEFLGRGDRDLDPQHHYSIMVEKIPAQLRSNKALFDYFNDLLPDKVHSAKIVMNVPELEYLVARRIRVVRRLEKAQLYREVTGLWETHVVGSPRFKILGVELAPLSSKGSTINLATRNREHHGANMYKKGQRVDSIEYYTRELAILNQQVKELQIQMKEISLKGDESVTASDWLSRIILLVNPFASDGEFQPSESFDTTNHIGFCFYDYGSFDDPDAPTTSYSLSEEEYIASHDPRSMVRQTHFEDPFPTPSKFAEKEIPLVGDNYLASPGNNISTSDLRTSSGTLIIQPGGEDKNHSFLVRFCNRIGFDFLSWGVNYIKHQMDVVVENVFGNKISSTGFVTFRDLPAAAFATSAQLTHKPDILHTTHAPETRDIIWQNAHKSAFLTQQRERAVNIFLTFGAIFWSFPLIAIQLLFNADSIANIPGMNWLETSDNAGIRALINGYLPVVALLGLILLLPLLFEWIAVNYENRKTYSDVQNSILTRYFYYQLANIYITTTAGSIWDSLGDMLENPRSSLDLLARSVPGVVGYFVAFLITKILAGLPMILLQFGGMARMLLYKLFFDQKKVTEREQEEIYRKEELLYGWEYPSLLLVLVICFTYACISPIILVFGAAYFQFAFIVYKKQVLYSYVPIYESGGIMFTSVCDRTLIGLISAQLTLTGYMSLHQGSFQPFVLLPLPFLTFSVMRDFNIKYAKPSKQLSLERARLLQKRDPMHQIADSFSENAYSQPSLASGEVHPRTSDSLSGNMV